VIDENGILHGACIIGRPVARLAGEPRKVLEVTRLVTDGTYNACSMLYLSYTIFGVDKGGVDRVIISSSPSALAIIVEMKEFTDSEPRASQSTTDLQNKTCLTT